jgi:hypothetical protein
MEPKTVTKMAAQGDVLAMRVEKIPTGAKQAPKTDRIVVAHSETGHDHYLAAAGVEKFDHPTDPLICYLRIEGPDGAVLTHARAHDTHAPLRLPPGVWEIRRQREYTPAGWARVED